MYRVEFTKHIMFELPNQKATDHIGGRGDDEKILLKWMSNKQEVTLGVLSHGPG
jgi:hypothetical protein